jgi:hypothetical protein
VIYLGLNNQEKDARIHDYCAAHAIEKVYILSPAKFRFDCAAPNAEQIEYNEIILYKFFYRLMQEINPASLIVVNECMRTQNRYDLTYNCIRHFLNQTRHQLIFQYLPVIDTAEDFMILFDFDTRSQWKREKFETAPLREARVVARPVPVSLTSLAVPTSDALQAEYARKKAALIDGIGLKDPHTIPRNLHLIGGKAKAQFLQAEGGTRNYLGRNDRLKLPGLQTYKEDAYPNTPYCVVEFCHNFIDFADVITLSGQSAFDVAVTDLKVDQWYFARFQDWARRVQDVATGL